MKRSDVAKFAPSVTVFLAFVIFGTLPLPSSQARNDWGARTMRVLFIGNSYTQYNNLPKMVRKVSSGLPLGPQLQTKGVTLPGSTLRRQWMRKEVHEALRHPGFTHVVIQPHSLDLFDRPAEAKKYALKFDEEIEKIGAQTILYSTWARKRGHFLYRKHEGLVSPEKMSEELQKNYRHLGEDLSATVAPVGNAWSIVVQRYPEIALYRKDGTHPSEAGTYLTACVFYGVLTGRSPEGSSWRPYPMTRSTAQKLQAVAAEALGFQG